MMLTQRHLFLDYCWLRNQPQQKPWKEFFSRVSVSVNTYGTCKSIKISGACRNWLSSRSASLCIVQRSIVCSSIVWNTAIFLHTFSSLLLVLIRCNALLLQGSACQDMPQERIHRSDALMFIQRFGKRDLRNMILWKGHLAYVWKEPLRECILALNECRNTYRTSARRVKKGQQKAVPHMDPLTFLETKQWKFRLYWFRRAIR